MNEINREKRLLQRIAQHLSGIDIEDMSHCEKCISSLLEQELYLVKEETDIHKSYFVTVYRVVK